MKAPHPRHHIPHFALAFAVIAASAAPLAARTLYVTPAGAGLKDGSSWANALAGYGASKKRAYTSFIAPKSRMSAR